jgi:RNA polymerase sigma factor (sigma-70 family)
METDVQKGLEPEDKDWIASPDDDEEAGIALDTDNADVDDVYVDPFSAHATDEAQLELAPDALSHYLRVALNKPLLSNEQEVALTTQFAAMSDGPERTALLNRIVEHNLRLVVKQVRRYSGMVNGNAGLDLVDLISAGNLGLRRAVEKFEPEYGFRFSTYAVNWIDQSIRRELGSFSRAVRLPQHMHQVVLKIRRLEREKARLGEELSAEVVAEELEIDLERAKRFMVYADMRAISSSQPYGEEGDDKLEDMLFDTQAPDVGHAVDERGVNENLAIALAKYLTPREYDVLMLRFGLTCESQTLEDAGKIFGLTRERIRQIQDKALKKLRSGLRMDGLDFEDFGLSTGQKADRPERIVQATPKPTTWHWQR